MPHVLIICLGDVGRSPRMQYHAHAIAELNKGNEKKNADATQAPSESSDPSNQWSVELLGYEGSPCFPHILSNPHILLNLLQPFSMSLTTLRGPAKLLMAPVKAVAQIVQLASFILKQVKQKPDVILVQNPPSIPTLILAFLASYYYNSLFLIDWHNFGYSLLGLNFGQSSPIVRVAKYYEQYVGGMADAHLCVTAAMQKWLKKEWEIDAHVLHDRSQSHFHRLSPLQAHQLFQSLLHEQKLCEKLLDSEWMQIDNDMLNASSTLNSKEKETFISEISSKQSAQVTPFTYRSKSQSNEICWRVDRPSLILSSTSWTADEDFTILARAIQHHDDAIANSRKRSTSSKSAAASTILPRAVYIITGKGPLRDAFVASINAMELKYSVVFTLFVSAGDYPKLLGSADLGVSLHYSSSGLDLPMKVVDMYGCGLPVCAVDFPALPELVQEGVNGRIFGRKNDEASKKENATEKEEKSQQDPAVELASQFSELFADFDPLLEKKDTSLAVLRRGAMEWAAVTWTTCWNESCAPLIHPTQIEAKKEDKKLALKSFLLKMLSFILILVGGLLMLS